MNKAVNATVLSMAVLLSTLLSCSRRTVVFRDVLVTSEEWGDISGCANALGEGSGYQVFILEDAVRLSKIVRDRARSQVVEMVGVSRRSENAGIRASTWIRALDFSSGTGVAVPASVHSRQIRQQLEDVCLSRAALWSPTRSEAQ